MHLVTISSALELGRSLVGIGVVPGRRKIALAAAIWKDRITVGDILVGALVADIMIVVHVVGTLLGVFPGANAVILKDITFS